MATAVASSVNHVAKGLDLSPADIARIVGSSVRTIQRWAAGEAEPKRESRDRLLELVAVTKALEGVIAPDDAHLWLYTPNRLLGWDKPADRVARGEWREVIAVIEALADGVYV